MRVRIYVCIYIYIMLVTVYVDINCTYSLDFDNLLLNGRSPHQSMWLDIANKLSYTDHYAIRSPE